MQKQVLFFLTTLFLNGFSALSQKVVPENNREVLWRQDIAVLRDKLVSMHPNPYHAVSKDSFNRSFDNIEAHLTEWSDYQILSQITATVNLLHDGHSAVEQSVMDSSKNYVFHYFPIQTFVFPDGIYVINAAAGFKAMVGKKIAAIGNVPISEVIARLTPLINRDEGNVPAVQNNLSFMVLISEYLNGAGITDKSYTASFTLQSGDGSLEKYELNAMGFPEYIRTFHMAAEADTELPLYRQNRSKNYWFTYLPETGMLYIKYNRELNDPQESLTAFCSRMQSIVDTAQLRRTVVDLRENQGGDAGTTQPLIRFLCENPRINQRGKLILLIGRRTQSAAAVFTVRMELNSRAIFVGEPTLSQPNLYSDARYFDLPNSRLRIGVSSILLNSGFTQDRRNTITPDIRIDPSAKDFFDHKDPVMDYVSTAVFPRQLAPISNGSTGDFTGRYQFGLLQSALVGRDSSGNLRLRIEDIASRDFLNTILYETAEGLYKTDVRTIDYVRIDSAKNLVIGVFGHEIHLSRLPEGSRSIRELFEQKDYEALKARLTGLAPAASPGDRLSIERYINSLGYNLLRGGNNAAALSFFILNVSMNPQSSNAYDSLGEAYLLSGDNTKAILNYNKSLELNPQNERARKKLVTLQPETK